LVLLLACESAAVVALVRLGSRPPFMIDVGHLGAWWRAVEPADAVAALVRLAALGVAAWLLTSTLVYLVVRVTESLPLGHTSSTTAAAPAAAASTRRRFLELATATAIRRLVDAAVVMTAAGALSAPAAAVAGGPTAPVRDGRARDASGVTTATVRTPLAPAVAPAVPAPSTATPAGAAAPAQLGSAPASVPAPATAVTGEEQHVVVAGDNLWDLAAARLTRLAQVDGRGPDRLGERDVARYWQLVCDANRARLRSGDVDLVFPGEVVVLPPPV
jgi:hypothetical protein